VDRGLIQLVVVVWPLMPEARRAAFLGFSRLATVCVGVLLLAGIYLSILRLPQLNDLWTTGYGRVLARQDRARLARACVGRLAQARRRAGGCPRR